MTIHYIKNGTEVPKVGKLFIDKIAFTVDVPEQQKKAFFNSFFNVNNNYGGYIKPKKHYRSGTQLPVNQACNSFLYIDCDPYDPEYLFARFEFNPAKASIGEVKSCIDQILPAGYTSLLEFGKPTRIDWTVDLKNLDIKNLLFRGGKHQISENYLKSGYIQTAYLGEERRILIYDKIAQMKKKNACNVVKETIPNTSMTRVESRLKLKIKDAQSLFFLDNPFQNIQLAVLPIEFTDNHGLFSLLLALARYEGYHQALYHLPKKQRAYYKQVFESQACSWWDPDMVWAGRAEALTKIGLFKSFDEMVNDVPLTNPSGKNIHYPTGMNCSN